MICLKDQQRLLPNEVWSKSVIKSKLTLGITTMMTRMPIISDDYVATTTVNDDDDVVDNSCNNDDGNVDNNSQNDNSGDGGKDNDNNIPN